MVEVLDQTVELADQEIAPIVVSAPDEALGVPVGVLQPWYRKTRGDHLCPSPRFTGILGQRIGELEGLAEQRHPADAAMRHLGEDVDVGPHPQPGVDDGEGTGKTHARGTCDIEDGPLQSRHGTCAVGRDL